MKDQSVIAAIKVMVENMGQELKGQRQADIAHANGGGYPSRQAEGDPETVQILGLKAARPLGRAGERGLFPEIR